MYVYIRYKYISRRMVHQLFACSPNIPHGLLVSKPIERVVHN